MDVIKLEHKLKKLQGRIAMQMNQGLYTICTAKMLMKEQQLVQEIDDQKRAMRTKLRQRQSMQHLMQQFRQQELS